ncbi:MAG: hypothetical protein O7A69_02740 [SAR324 cluster bacterium]|nr:hypothetical protein [SAR324 cluster bacterium]
MISHGKADKSGLIETLEEIHELVLNRAAQTVVQLAENAVLYWIRVVDGNDTILPRFSADGYVPAAFHFGMESRADNRLDAHAPCGGEADFLEQFGQRLDALGSEIEEYRAQSGYRSSADNCDWLMVEVNRFSRYLGSCCLEAETLAAAQNSDMQEQGGPPGPEGSAARLLRCVRRQLFIWEPLLNDVIVSWDQNSLKDFDHAVKLLAHPIALSDAEREALVVQPGYPLRPMGRPRLKVTVFEPALRPLRTKSMYSVRHGQLSARIQETENLPANLAGELREDMRHFTSMIRSNRFMLANTASFWDTHRVGLPLIRGRPNSHPFLHDPMDFFKKAVLFHNRTYTVAGGGVDRIYLQVKQLERLYKFQPTGGSRVLRHQIQACQQGWDENRWETFTEALLGLAERIRAEHAQPAP